jgi:S1-C subfamily serine protease
VTQERLASLAVSAKEEFRLSENLMSIERSAQLRYAALVALTMSILVGNITATGAVSRARIALLVESRYDCQQQEAGRQEAGRKDEYAETAPEIYERVAPAVVLIHAISINPYRLSQRVEHSVGSGFIIDPEGLVVTNSHVAFGRQSLFVRLNDGTHLPAQLIGADPILDIAVLRIPKLKQNALAAVKLGDSDCVRVGEDVLALGSPLGMDQSLTRGIVSAINRVLPPISFTLRQPLIQVDTPINPGNSGGPLLNRRGEAIGITTAIVPNAQNIGLAIPINLVKEVLPSLVQQGRLIRPWLGFHGQFIDHNLQRMLRIPLEIGFLVEVVEPGSPAEQVNLLGGKLELTIAGYEYLIGGDIITKLNGTPLTTPENIMAALAELRVGSTVNLTIFRAGEYVDVQYTLPERPLLPGDIADQTTVAPLDGTAIRRASGLKF